MSFSRLEQQAIFQDSLEQVVTHHHGGEIQPEVLQDVPPTLSLCSWVDSARKSAQVRSISLFWENFLKKNLISDFFGFIFLHETDKLVSSKTVLCWGQKNEVCFNRVQREATGLGDNLTWWQIILNDGLHKNGILIQHSFWKEKPSPSRTIIFFFPFYIFQKEEFGLRCSLCMAGRVTDEIVMQRDPWALVLLIWKDSICHLLGRAKCWSG